MRVHALVLVSFLLVPLGCASSGTGAAGGTAGGRAADGMASASRDDLPMPSKIVHDPSEVPAEVRAIEDLIDLRSAIVAGEVVIEVSKNYQFDVSLTGDRVANVLEGRPGVDKLAMGPSTAFVRNLKIKADDRIRLYIADFGTKPFIRVTASGGCSYIAMKDGKPEVRRAQGILIRDDDLRFVDEQETPASALAR